MFTSTNVRFALWALFGLALFWNYQAWQVDYAPLPPPPPAPVAAAAPGTTAAPGAAPVADLDSAAPTVAAPAAAPLANGTASTAPPANDAAMAPPAQDAAGPVGAGKVHIVTDVLDMDISLRGGELSRADLPDYAESKGSKTPQRLLNRDSAASTYVLQSGLVSSDGSAAPTHLAEFTGAASEARLAKGQDELRLPLRWTNGAGITVTKTYIFHRGRYQIDLEYLVQNASGAPWSYASYAQLLRMNEPVATSYFHPDTYSFKGPAYFNGAKYQKLQIARADTSVDSQVKGGWIAGMQHHFVAAIVPNGNANYHYKLAVRGNEYLIAATGAAQSVAAGAQAKQSETLFVGPKLQDQLDVAGPKLHLVTDYGWLAPVAQLLYGLLAFIHRFVGNWGVTIMLATLVLKLLFYPLSEASGRSMAKMKVLQPRLKNLQETYKDQRDKLGQAMMELYKKEKVNPAAGCLPMVVQIPVFIAFYWTLLESVEMRQAPFVGWINDLSSRDPWFILPLIMAGASYFQYRLNPQMGADPLQAKIMGLMPVAMSIMFAFFPAGLVLYWVTNTVLTIAQQWNINRRIAAAAAKARR